MGDGLESLPFNEWVAHVFDHDVREPSWYFDMDAPVWEGPATLTLDHVTRLFKDPVDHLARYSDAQLNQGFWYLVGESGSTHMHALSDLSAPLEPRIRCVRSFSPLFEQLFAVRCSSHSSHLIHVRPPDFNPLNFACYMWWDIIPFAGDPADPAHRDLDAAALGVMEEILSIESLPCRESALHGLGHWQHAYPRAVEAIIDRALTKSAAWPRELKTYALNAKSGCIL